ncbi:ribosomal-protein-alanine acetyltransferase [Aureimonas endophytica]|uniref:Ribosomal-protein-alanine acetyltransferase n=1 Tax=Aureimonas endophytica TaxID=2027858 RepID=A0A917A167_9HYPH|nr:GNAT family N-acetyltransferase [Aureimonas endophytica]GGE21859.1 ribosomal-protein-alanine acetyltransferase [Aureimonas endophytica]
MYWYLPWVWTMSFWDSLVGAGDPAVATELEMDDVDFAAELHSEAFDRPWSGDEFASLLATPGTFGFLARRVGSPGAAPVGVVLVRAAADEAEILTIAVSKRARGQGIGRMLMDQVLQRLHADRIASLFLEVDEENAPALALYGRLRFAEVGRRPAYYADANGRRTSALVLKRTLR